MTAQEEGLGGCLLVTDEKNEIICNVPGEAEILVRNKFGLYAVVLCKAHKSAHREFYENLNLNRRRHTGRVTPNQGEGSANQSSREPTSPADSSGKELRFVPAVPVRR